MKLFVSLLLREPYRLLSNFRSREFLRLAFKFGEVKRHTPCNIKFLHYRFSVPDALSFIWQYKEIFADESYKFLSATDSPVIYDCGSNVGLSCLYFKQIYPEARITAFEADNNIAGYLRENLANNNVPDITIINKAVWISNDGVRISPDGADGASIFSSGEKILVPSVRLKEMLETEDHIDMLKMDIEGAEADVLQDCGQLLSRVTNIFIEFHSFVEKPQRLNEVLQLLSDNGFRYFLKQAQHRDQPLVNRRDKNFPELDLLINIFAYKESDKHTNT